MDTGTGKKAMKDKSVQAFVKHVSTEMEELKTLDGIETDDPIKVAVEVKARKLAYKKIEAILEPLLNVSEEKVEFNKKEYIV